MKSEEEGGNYLRARVLELGDKTEGLAEGIKTPRTALTDCFALSLHIIRGC